MSNSQLSRVFFIFLSGCFLNASAAKSIPKSFPGGSTRKATIVTISPNFQYDPWKILKGKYRASFDKSVKASINKKSEKPYNYKS